MPNNLTFKHNHTNRNQAKFILEVVSFYYLISIEIIGIFGNFIALIIFTRPSLNKKTNTGLLFTILCILNVLNFIEDMFIGSNSKTIFYYFIILPCNMESFIKRSLKQILSWIQVVISFERFFQVIYPTKADIFRKKVFCFCLFFFKDFRRYLIH